MAKSNFLTAMGMAPIPTPAAPSIVEQSGCAVPDPELKTGTADVSSTVPVSITVPETGTVRTANRIRRASRVQDGHSSGEQCLYATMWDAGRTEGRESRLITVGWDKMGRLANLSHNNVRIACSRLIGKLALDVIAPEDSNSRTGRTYRVWCWSKVIERRIAAGMEWYVKTRGVEFVRPPAEFPEARSKWDARVQSKPEKGTVPVSRTVHETSTDTVPVSRRDTVPVSSTPLKQSESKGNRETTTSSSQRDRTNLTESAAPALAKGPASARVASETPCHTENGFAHGVEISPAEVAVVLAAIRSAFGRGDDGVARQVLSKTRAVSPDVTVDEVVEFIHLEASSIRSNANIRNPVGLLTTHIPGCCQGENLRRFRAEAPARRRAQAEDILRHYSSRTDEERAWAIRVLKEQGLIDAEGKYLG